MLGAIAGLLIGVAAAFGRARLNRRLDHDRRRRDGLRHAGDRRDPAARLPRAGPSDGHIIGDFEASSPLVEAFRSTRATLSLFSVGNGKPS